MDAADAQQRPEADEGFADAGIMGHETP